MGAKMAIIMLIGKEIARSGVQDEGDVVGVFHDSHRFSETELKRFDFLALKGTRAEVREKMREVTPKVVKASLWKSDNEYHFEEDEKEVVLETIEVYQAADSNRWYKLVDDYKYARSVGALTEQEKQALEITNVKDVSVDAATKKLSKDLLTISGNDVEITELREEKA